MVRARALRRSQTEAERKLWGILRDRRLSGFKFRRQVPIGRYVADFACFEAMVVIELDGSQHFDNRHDVRRDAELVERGFEVVRFWNSELTDNRDGVLEAIWSALNRLTGLVEGRSPSPGLRPPSPTRGEGLTAIQARNGLSVGPSPLKGEGGRGPDDGGARS